MQDHIVRTPEPIQKSRRLGKQLLHTLGYALRVATIFDPVQQDRELVAAEARDRIAFTQTTLEPSSGRDQAAFKTSN